MKTITNKEELLEAIKNDCLTLRNASERLRNDKEFLKEIENTAK